MADFNLFLKRDSLGKEILFFFFGMNLQKLNYNKITLSKVNRIVHIEDKKKTTIYCTSQSELEPSSLIISNHKVKVKVNIM